MKRYLQLRHQRRSCLALVFGLVMVTFGAPLAHAETLALVNNINVDTTADEYNVSPNGNCSLREAIQSANDNADFGGCTHSGIYGNDKINIPAGTYSLTRAGIDDDANLTADLDILQSVTLNGVGRGEGTNGTSTSINGGATYSGRLIHVLVGTVTIQNLTIERGHLPNGRAGAGLRSEPGTTTILTNVAVGLNVADGNAGGILNRGTMTLNGSFVTNNQTLAATQGGGGIFNDDNATLTLNDSVVQSNLAVVEDNIANNLYHGGGGIYDDTDASLTLNNTTVDNNIADDPGGSAIVLTNGGGIFYLGTTTLTQSTISNNVSRGNDARGGGIGCGFLNAVGSNHSCGITAAVDRSLITGNSAEGDPDFHNDDTVGGGIFAPGPITISNSVISNNTSSGGGIGAGGLYLEGAIATISNTTISGNHATGGSFAFGGGIKVSSGASLRLINSTVSGNTSDSDGGGLYVSGEAKLFNVSIVNNTSNADGSLGGTGGGMVIVAASGVVFMRNSVLAENFENDVGNHDDCDGNIQSNGYNLVQNSSGCTLFGIDHDQTDVLALLGPLAANGGAIVGASTSPIVAGLGTHMPDYGPGPVSPLIDRGTPTDCLDPDDQAITIDQRGQPRPVDGPDADLIETCDIGAVEVQGLSDRIFADSFE